MDLTHTLRLDSPDLGEVSRPVRVPIRIKFTFTYLLLAIVIALVGTYLVFRIVFENADERYTNQLIEAGKLGSE